MTIPVIKYPSSDTVLAFSTERGEGVDLQSPYSGFSICSYTGDTPEHIQACRMALCEYLGIESRSLFVPHQTHSVEIATVSDGYTDLPDGVDGLVTATRGVALAINTADCVAVLMADPEADVIGAAHSGWRGTVGGIASKCVGRMVALGADPERISVWMGPSICRDCFEVGEEVAERFSGFPGVVVRRPGVKPHIDLAVAIMQSLTESGVKAENIALPPDCSFCNPDRFFSARRLGIASGRTLSVIMLK